MAESAGLLREARERAGLTQAKLARRADVSEDTVFSAEAGRRRPRLETVRRLLDALGADQQTRDAVFVAAGYDPEPRGRLQQYFHRRWSPEQIQAEIETYPWPYLAMNERMEIAVWNAAAVAVAELDFGVALPELHQRNMMRLACMRHFRERAVNWLDNATTLVAFYKDDDYDVERSEEDTRYFQALVHDLATNPLYSDVFPQVMRLWETIPPRRDEARLVLPTTWRVSTGEVLSFQCVLTSWSDYDGAWAYDWMPADGATWAGLDAHRPMFHPSTAETLAAARRQRPMAAGRSGRGCWSGCGTAPG